MSDEITSIYRVRFDTRGRTGMPSQDIAYELRRLSERCDAFRECSWSNGISFYASFEWLRQDREGVSDYAMTCAHILERLGVHIVSAQIAYSKPTWDSESWENEHVELWRSK